MMLTCNRFALVPHLCLQCKRYIWLEGYRRAEVWENFIDKPIKENICKECLTKFDLCSKIIQRTRNEVLDTKRVIYNGKIL